MNRRTDSVRAAGKPRGKAHTWPAAMMAAILFVLAAGPTNGAAPPTNQITIKDFMFVPMSLTVRAGTEVTWANHDDEPHTVISDAGVFRSSAIDTHERFSYRFDHPGTYHFLCSIHPRMLGTIIVLPHD